MPTSLKRIADKAKREKQYRFENLYGLLNEDFLRETFKQLNKQAASGVDHVDYRKYEENLDENLKDLVERLKRKKYRAKLVKRKNIPKDGGKVRPLGIPVLEDKLLQTATSRILQAIFEEDFLRSSYGYRPNVGVHDARRKVTSKLQYGKFGYVVEADIQGFFSNLDHEWLLRMLRERINDGVFLGLIRKWLKAGVLEEDNSVLYPESGTPQGGSVSPVLANVYLHYVLDLWFQKVFCKRCEGEAYLVRYADDFIVMFQYRKEAERFYRVFPQRLAMFGLTLAKEKTRIVNFNRFRKDENNHFDFLGFEFRWGTNRVGKDQLYTWTSLKKLKASLKNLTQWCRENRNLGTRAIFEALNRKLRGYYNHYGIRGNAPRLRKFFYAAMRILRKWLNRRSQRRSCSWKKFFIWLKVFKVETPKITHKRPANEQLSFKGAAFRFC